MEGVDFGLCVERASPNSPQYAYLLDIILQSF